MTDQATLRRSDVIGLSLFALFACALAWFAIATQGIGVNFPEVTVGHADAIFLALWLAIGVPVWSALTNALDRVGAATGASARLTAWIARGSDRQWIACGAVAAFVIAVVLRLVVFRNLPITDDEAAYLFSSRLLASGRLTVPSPPLKAFFDQVFIVNDGRMYSQYFLGWPALMLPGTVLGLQGFINAIYSALAVPPVFWVARRYANEHWSRVGILLYLGSPALMYAAATGLSHTSCVCLLTWCTWAALRSTDDDHPAWSDPAVAILFSITFFVRPTVALGIGVPLLAVWAFGWWRRGDAKVPALALFALPAAAFGVLFFVLNRALTGDALLTPYVAFDRYLRATTDILWPALSMLDPWRALVNLGVVVARLGTGLFGWPLSLAFLPKRGGPRLFWAMLGTFVLAHATVNNPGIETLPATHFLELSLPLLWLTIIGASGEPPYGLDIGRPGPAILAGTILALCGYDPIMLSAIHRSQQSVADPLALGATTTTPAVIFAPSPMHCESGGPAWVAHHPLPDPDFTDARIWVNHLTVDLDRRLMREVYPNRHGYVIDLVPPCTLTLHDLDEPGLTLPDGEWFLKYKPEGLKSLAPYTR